MASADPTVDSVLVRLLDSSRQQTLQEWQFESVSVISIGRSPEREIVIPDGRISRLHAVLQYRDDQWWLVSFGKNGVHVAGQMVEEEVLEHGSTFRLGQQGPILEFCVATPSLESLTNTAPEFRIVDEQSIQLDSGKLNADVQEIVDGEFFQSLLERSKQFRKNKADG